MNKGKGKPWNDSNSYSRTQNWSTSRSKKIRIKTLEQSVADKRKTFSQNIKLPSKQKNSERANGGLKMNSIAKIQAPKTYYNIYENNSNFEENTFYNSRSIWSKSKAGDGGTPHRRGK